jgi:hypothetical protein
MHNNIIYSKITEDCQKMAIKNKINQIYEINP